MMISSATQAFVWIWLPKATTPIVAGRIDYHDQIYKFTYSKKYLINKDAIPLSPFELPLQSGTSTPGGLNVIHSCLRDAAPDAWGRRIIDYQYPKLTANELDYMLLSADNRIGALDFNSTSNKYSENTDRNVNLSEVIAAVTCLEQHAPIPEDIHCALLHGTSIGGARPKILLEDNQSNYIVKISSSNDKYNVIKAEFIAMRLAKLTGINVANVSLKSILNKDLLFVERFDRSHGARKLMLSGLSLLNLDELEARHANYCDLASIIRKHFNNPNQQLTELYKRLVFNILIGNTDDHARNHAAFWDGLTLSLTPAYDLCPQPRLGFTASQAMAIAGIEGNLSTLTNALSVAKHFHISQEDAKNIIDTMLNTVTDNWKQLCSLAKLTSFESQQLWERVLFILFAYKDIVKLFPCN